MAVTAAPRTFESLVLDYLAYLELERGLSRNTLEAYRSDLLQYGAWLSRTGRDALAHLLAQPRGSDPAVLRDRALLEVMYACGLRASEAVDLTVRDVDVDTGILRARGKGSKERIVPIGSKAVMALRAYLESGR